MSQCQLPSASARERNAYRQESPHEGAGTTGSELMIMLLALQMRTSRT